MALEERIWSKIQAGDPGDCWPWTGHKVQGYGRIKIQGKSKLAHRIVYENEVGAIPAGMEIDHTCHNNTDCIDNATCPHKACCNPSHLEAVTHKVNNQRGNNGRHNAIKTHCRHDHEYTEENTQIIMAKGGPERRCKTCTAAARKRWAKK